MTRNEMKQVEGILNFLKNKGHINSFEMNSDNIVITTNDTDKDDIDFLKFRIMSAISLINEDFDNSVIVNVASN